MELADLEKKLAEVNAARREIKDQINHVKSKTIRVRVAVEQGDMVMNTEAWYNIETGKIVNEESLGGKVIKTWR